MLPIREYKYHRAWAFLLIIYGQLNCPDSSCRQRAKRPVIGSTPKSLLLTVQMYKKAFNHARTLLIILRFITHFIVVVYIRTIFLCQIPFTIKLFNRQKGSTPFLKCPLVLSVNEPSVSFFTVQCCVDAQSYFRGIE